MVAPLLLVAVTHTLLWCLLVLLLVLNCLLPRSNMLTGVHLTVLAGTLLAHYSVTAGGRWQEDKNYMPLHRSLPPFLSLSQSLQNHQRFC